MEMNVSPRVPKPDFRCAAIRLLLVALAGAEWAAVCIVVSRSAFGI